LGLASNAYDEAVESPPAKAELQSVQVVLDGADAEMEDVGNLLATLVGDEERDDLTLPRTEVRTWLRRVGKARTTATEQCGMSTIG